MNEPLRPDPPSHGLHRHFGVLHATALNVTMIIGAGVFITIPLMLLQVPGPYAVLGWLAAGLLVLADGWVWGQLARRHPVSGGTYVYLLESFGRERVGRMMAFLFLWQFMVSGPLELGSGLAAAAQFANYLSPGFPAWNAAHQLVLGPITIDTTRVLMALVGIGLLVLLYRRITFVGRLMVTFWVGVLGACLWILVVGAMHFNFATAFSNPRPPDLGSFAFWKALGGTMILAIYSYLGYYNVCYIGDEVRDPGRTIPRSIILSSVLVCVLFVGLHLAMLGTVPWQEIVAKGQGVNDYSLAGDFMQRLYGTRAAAIVTVLLIWSCLGSVFAGLLGYSRIPYSAARQGHFFRVLGRLHPTQHIPHISLLLIGGMTLFWSFFDLQDLISALITTRILEQFIGQTVGLALWRHREAGGSGWRYGLFMIRCALPVVGWAYLYVTSGPIFILLGLATLGTGAVAFFVWSWWARRWPFAVAVISEKPAEDVVGAPQLSTIKSNLDRGAIRPPWPAE